MGQTSPDLTRLSSAVAELLPGAVVVSREANVRNSSFLTEVVTCRVPGGEDLRLFFKYGGGFEEATGFGHRGGVSYEARVYQDLLQPLGVRTVPFYGTHLDSEAGATWLILGFQPGWCIEMRLGLAARWIGEFHRAATARFGSRPPAWLKRYDRAHYAQVAHQTREHAERLGVGLPWLPAACEAFESTAVDLLGSRPAVIHGELYPHNVMRHLDTVLPVDWESAAFGAGEIDLASLTEGWPAADVDECLREYAAARWPGGSPQDFDAAFDAARLYLDFRWLSEKPDDRWYLDDLVIRGERLGRI
jgi:hypothetical protein